MELRKTKQEKMILCCVQVLESVLTSAYHWYLLQPSPMAVAGTLPSSGNLFLDYVCTLNTEDRSFLYAQPACGESYAGIAPSFFLMVTKMVSCISSSFRVSHVAYCFTTSSDQDDLEFKC